MTLAGWEADGGAEPASTPGLRRPRRVDGWRLVEAPAALILLLLAILLLAPLLLRLAAEGGPILFRQTRIGRGGRPFTLYKLRSMTPDAEARLLHLVRSDPAFAAAWQAGRKAKDDPRITRLGRFLRRSSLDELPQLFNVVRGDMGFIGPRPIVAAERGRYGEHFAAYASVRPGLTGLWQVSGRNTLGYGDRVACDRDYARRRSFALNVAILARTPYAVLSRRGAF